MSKWTSGEWRVEPQPERNMILIGTDDYIVCEINEVVDQDCDNANLISAAPDLYEALEYCIDCLGDEFALPIDCIDQARSALAKARGNYCGY